MPKFKVYLIDGPRRTEIADGKEFDRGSAALAWLIDFVRDLPGHTEFLYEHDDDHPGCYDCMHFVGRDMVQYAINEVK